MVEWDDVVDAACLGETTVNTDEWNGYNRIGKRATAGSSQTVDPFGAEMDVGAGPGWRRGARGARQHAGGLWTGLRNFLRPFRGVSKWFLAQYVAVFQWGHNQHEVTDELTRVLLNFSPGTDFPI